MAILTHFARKTLVVASASVASLPPPVPQRPFWKFWAKQPRAFAAVEAAEDPFMWCVRPLPPCAQMLPCPSSTTHARPSFFSPVPCLLGSRPMCASRACPPTWLPLPQRRGVSFLTSAARLTTPSLRPTAALATPTPPTPPSPSTPSPRPHSHARPRSSPTTPRSSPTTPRSSLHHPQILSHQPQILFTSPRSSPTSPRSSPTSPLPPDTRHRRWPALYALSVAAVLLMGYRKVMCAPAYSLRDEKKVAATPSTDQVVTTDGKEE